LLCYSSYKIIFKEFKLTLKIHHQQILILSIASLLCIISNTHTSQEIIRIAQKRQRDHEWDIYKWMLSDHFNMQNKQTESTLTNSLFGEIIEKLHDWQRRKKNTLLLKILSDPTIPIQVQNKIKSLFNATALHDICGTQPAHQDRMRHIRQTNGGIKE